MSRIDDFEPELTSHNDGQKPLSQATKIETRNDAAGIKGKTGDRKKGWDNRLKKPIVTKKGGGMDFPNRAETQSFPKIKINLDWSQPPVQGFMNSVRAAMGKIPRVDLDLGCLYELKDGSRGVVQAFGDIFGDYNGAPYIQLQGDDSTGEGLGEDLYINGEKWQNFRRIVVYAYIYKGACSWSKTDARAILTMQGYDPLEVELCEFCDGLPVCAMLKLENKDGSMKLTNLNEYYSGHAEMDRAFGFGINWGQGEK